MNIITEIAEQHGRDYITPEDVTEALLANPGDLHRVRIDVLEVIGKQTRFGAEDVGLCAFVAYQGANKQ